MLGFKIQQQQQQQQWKREKEEEEDENSCCISIQLAYRDADARKRTADE